MASKHSSLSSLRDLTNAFFEPILAEFDCHIFWHLPVSRPDDPPPTSQHAQVLRAGSSVLFAEISATATQEHLITALSQRMLRHVVVPAQRQWDSGFVCTRHGERDVKCAFFEVHADGKVVVFAECLLDVTGKRIVEESVERCLDRFEPRY